MVITIPHQKHFQFFVLKCFERKMIWLLSLLYLISLLHLVHAYIVWYFYNFWAGVLIYSLYKIEVYCVL
jgi:hypothetical protein